MNPVTGESLADGLRGRYDIARELTHRLLDVGCAAARMSEGILHIAPPYISTTEDLEFIANATEAVLDQMEGVIKAAVKND